METRHSILSSSLLSSYSPFFCFFLIVFLIYTLFLSLPLSSSTLLIFQVLSLLLVFLIVNLFPLFHLLLFLFPSSLFYPLISFLIFTLFLLFLLLPFSPIPYHVSPLLSIHFALSIPPSPCSLSLVLSLLL